MRHAVVLHSGGASQMMADMRAAAFVFISALWSVGTGCSREVAGGRADGREVYDTVCARCHGPDGRGTVAGKQLGVKDLSAPQLQRLWTPAFLRQQIRDGSKNRLMPAFKHALNAAQIDALIAYLATLSK